MWFLLGHSQALISQTELGLKDLFLLLPADICFRG